MTDTTTRLLTLATAALLGLALLVAMLPRSTKSARSAVQPRASGLRPQAAGRIPLLSHVLARQTRLPAPKPSTGGWTLEECLSDNRRPDAATEVAALRASALPEELALPLALEATDRGYQDALAQASALAPADGLAVLEAALIATPEEHLIGRLRLLDAMVQRARACRGLAERRELAARRNGVRQQLVEIAARAGVATDESRREATANAGTDEALEPLLAGLLATKTDGGAD